jgi:transcriptional regulator with GAF, ATPase, and Fis domain
MMDRNGHDDVALAEARSRIAVHKDTAGFLMAVAEISQEVLDADAVGVMVKSASGRLQLLVASSHRSAELELHQSQTDEGPCVDAAHGGAPTALAGGQELARRWPTFGPSMVDAGFLSVHSAPLRWRDLVIGAMALFRKQERPFDQADDEAAQFFADLVAQRIMGDEDAGLSAPFEQITAALSSRITIERAKGFIAEIEGVDMEQAYRLLIASARGREESLTLTAEDLVAGNRPDGAPGLT